MTDINATKPSWLEPDGCYHTNTATLAAQLHAIADAIAALGDTPISETALSVSLQTLQHRPHRARVQTVDLLSQALGMEPVIRTLASGDVHYGPDYARVGTVNPFACVVTAAEVEAGRQLAAEAVAAPKPLVSDETIREAKEIGERYPDGVNYAGPCDKCETTGQNCPLHRDEALRCRAAQSGASA